MYRFHLVELRDGFKGVRVAYDVEVESTGQWVGRIEPGDHIDEDLNDILGWRVISLGFGVPLPDGVYLTREEAAAAAQSAVEYETERREGALYVLHGLTGIERQVLDYEAAYPDRSVEQRGFDLWDLWSVTPDAYYQFLFRLCRKPEALPYQPTVVNRVNATRGRRNTPRLGDGTRVARRRISDVA